MKNASHRRRMLRAPERGVIVAAAFFAVSGLLHLSVSLWEMSRPLAFWPVWETLGRTLFHLLLAAGLWRRLALCRSIALVYCLAALVTYAAALALALAGTPVRVPASVVAASLFEVPSCALLFPYLRSPAAARLFPRPLFGP
jgi:hypothetical protein